VYRICQPGVPAIVAAPETGCRLNRQVAVAEILTGSTIRNIVAARLTRIERLLTDLAAQHGAIR